MSSLVLLSSEFPYGKGEQFIDNELPFLCGKYKTVYILSFCNNPSSFRKLPSNCINFNFPIKNNKLKYLTYMFYGLKNKKKSLFKAPKQLKKKLVSYYEVGRALFKIKLINTKIDKIIEKENLVIYSYWFLDNCLVALYLKSFLKEKTKTIKLISRAHGYDLYSERNKFNFLPFQEEYIKNFDAIFPISLHGLNYLSSKYPFFRNKFLLSRLGVPNKGQSTKFSKNIFFTCSNLIKLKRVCLFAKSFVKATHFNKEIHWYCIGNGPELAKIRRICKKCNQVHLLGSMSNEKIIEFYTKQGCGYFVNVSIYEGLPVSIMEAMSVGMPIIATDVGGNSELVNAENGYLLSKNVNTKLLTKQILTCASLNDNEFFQKSKSSVIKWSKMVNTDVNYPNFIEKISNL